MSLLAVSGLEVAYRRDGCDMTALFGIDLTMEKGESLAVIGESGSGKSTLSRAIAGLLPPEARMRGRFAWPSFENKPVPGRDIGFVFQDPAASLDPVLTVGEQVAEVAHAHLGMRWREAFDHAEQLLARVSLPDPASLVKAYPHQLSGGQKQRVAIAAAVAAGPKLLITDEATSALDTVVQAGIVALIRDIAATEGMALLFVTHDIALAAQLARRTMVLRGGRLVEEGLTEQLITAPQAAYTRMLIDTYAKTPWRAEPEAGR
jgi:peptide/nickel transport system ATP-binding protein